MNKQPEVTEATRQKLIDAFLSLYEVKLIEKIKIKEITDLAGYNRGTFYVHFTDIYDLLEQIELSVLPSEEELKQVFKLFNSNSIKPFTALIETYSRNEKYFNVLLGENSNQHFYFKLKQLIKNVLCNYLKQNNWYTDSVESEFIIEYVVSALMGISNYWLRNKKKISFEELTEIQSKVLTKSTVELLFEKRTL